MPFRVHDVLARLGRTGQAVEVDKTVFCGENLRPMEHSGGIMDTGFTMPLTVAVPVGEFLLFEGCRGLRLPVEECALVHDDVVATLTGLLDRLPAGTPEVLVDRLCDVLADVGDFLEMPSKPTSENV